MNTLKAIGIALIGTLSLSFVSLAAEPERDRASLVRATASAGHDSYTAASLDTTLGLDPVWALKGGLTNSRSAGVDPSTEARLGGDAKVTHDLKLGMIGIGRADPNDVHAFGVSPYADWILSSLWNAETLQTSLFTTLTLLNYSQSSTQTTTAGTKRRPRLISQTINTSIQQRSISLGVSQDLLPQLFLTVQYGVYGYSSDGKDLSSAVQNRPASFSGIDGTVNGFPKNSASASLTWLATDSWDLAALFSTTLTVVDPQRTNTLGLQSHYSFDRNWGAMGEISYSKTKDATQIAGTEGATNGAILTLGGEYRW